MDPSRPRSSQQQLQFDDMLHRLHQSYLEMVESLREQKRQNDADVNAAWADVERARLDVLPRQPRAFSQRSGEIRGVEDQRVPSSGFPPVRSPTVDDARRSYDSIAAAPTSYSFWVTVWPGFHRGGAPVRVLVHHNYKTLNHVIQHAAAECNCRPSPSILYTPDGKTVSSLDQLIPSGNYLIFPSGCLYREESVPTALLEMLAFTMRSSLGIISGPQYRSNSSAQVPFTAEY